MNEIILHPSRDFLNARNPSSPFQYRIAMAMAVWKYIDDNVLLHPEYPNMTSVAIWVNHKLYQAHHPNQLFNLIKHHWILDDNKSLENVDLKFKYSFKEKIKRFIQNAYRR